MSSCNRRAVCHLCSVQSRLTCVFFAERNGVNVGRMRESESCRLSCRPSSCSLASSRSSTGSRDWERAWRREGLVLGKRAANTSSATLRDLALPFWRERERGER